MRKERFKKLAEQAFGNPEYCNWIKTSKENEFLEIDGGDPGIDIIEDTVIFDRGTRQEEKVSLDDDDKLCSKLLEY